MADMTPDSLDDLSTSQRAALTWLSEQPGDGPHESTGEYRGPTWSSLESRGLVERDQAGHVTLTEAGRSLLGTGSEPAADETPVAEQAAPEQPEQAAAPEQSTAAPPLAGSEAVAAAAPPLAGSEAVAGGEVEAPTGEDAEPVPAREVPIHEQTVGTLGELRSGMRGVDPALGSYRVLGEPEKLWGTKTGQVRVPVMRMENGQREWLRGEPDTAVTPDS